MKKTLVADTAFLDDSLKVEFTFQNVFPMSPKDGAYRSTLDDLLRRSILQSDFYAEILDKLIDVFSAENSHVGKQHYNTIRPVLVWITTFFCDRTLRVFHLLQSNNKSNLQCLNMEPSKPFYALDDMSQSWEFNQSLISRISKKLNISSISPPQGFTCPEYPRQYPLKNLLFTPPDKNGDSIKIKLLNKAFTKLREKAPTDSPIQPIGFHDDYFFAQKGFYSSKKLFRRVLIFSPQQAEIDVELRSRLKENLKKDCFDSFHKVLLKTLQINENEYTHLLADEFIDTFLDWYPSGYLEGASTNLDHALDLLRPHDSLKAIVGNDTISMKGHFLSAACQRLGKPSISFQHGGHYGYIQDMAFCGQQEFPMCTKFISWGWDRLEDHFISGDFFKLPSPKMSEKLIKGNYFKHDRTKADILFYSNLFHRFPHASMSAHSRVDFIDETKNSLVNFFSDVSKADLSVHHKPYSLKFKDLYPDLFKDIENSTGPNYKLLTPEFKGLSRELLIKYKLIVWDQIGTGMLECFNSKVPTMVYWQRIYSREIPWVGDMIKELEEVGIVHSTTDSFINSTQEYLSNPKKWMENTRRNKAIEAFCHMFARSSDNWAEEWESFFKNKIINQEQVKSNDRTI
jgi:putative transferase (TIGR04331 family)